MKILSTLAIIALAVQCTLAAPERKLLREGYDTPIHFSDLAGLTDITPTESSAQKYGSDTALPSVDSITKGGTLPSTVSLPVTKGSGIGKNVVPTDLTTVAGRSGMNSLTGGSGLGSITNGVGKGNKLRSRPSSTTGDVPKGISSVTDNVSGLTDGQGAPSTSTSGGKQTYKSGAADESNRQSENRTLTSPKKTPPPSPKSTSKETVKTSTKKTPKKASKKTSKSSPKKSPKPNVKPTPKPDPEKSPVQRPVE